MTTILAIFGDPAGSRMASDTAETLVDQSENAKMYYCELADSFAKLSQPGLDSYGSS